MFPRATLAAIMVLASIGTAFGQVVPPMPGPSPVLYVNFIGPEGQEVSFYRGKTEVALPAPVVAGLRPGYIYRVKLSGWKRYPNLVVYPSLEVRGSICLPPQLRVASHPAPIQITEADLDRVLAGSLITKVIYLEDPEHAIPDGTEFDRPIELDLPPGIDLMTEARERGRIMLIVRLGQRDLGLDELAHQSVPGTVLLPGEKVLPPPQAPPCLPTVTWKVYDPTLGPKPLKEECLQDGGDIGIRAGFGPEGRLRGVDPSDTVAEYSDSHGWRHITVSNRVCLCVPRYVVLRTECPIADLGTSYGPEKARKVLGQDLIAMRVPSLEAQMHKQPTVVQGRRRPNEVLGKQATLPLLGVHVIEAVHLDIGPAVLLGTTRALTLTAEQRLKLLKQMEMALELSQPKGLQQVTQTEGTSVLGRVTGPEAISAVVETREITVCCDEVPCPPDKPLVLFKWVDCKDAKVGDVVTFYLKYSNHGGQPIADIAVVDSLTARLEYVAGSAKSDRPAVFTTQANEAGSVVLRWEINGRLQPNGSGVVSFQARIR